MTCRDNVTRRGTYCQRDDAVIVMIRHATHVTQSEHNRPQHYVISPVFHPPWHKEITISFSKP